MPIASSPDRHYAARPRWQRWLRCAHVLPCALRLAFRVERHLRPSDAASQAHPAALPDLLDALTTAQAARFDPSACRAVAHRLMDRGRPDRCLPRALVLYGLLQHTPAPDVQFCLGVHPDAAAQSGTFAHAWVEVDGAPFGEGTDPRQTHRLLYRYPADAS